jgi:TonB family protein
MGRRLIILFVTLLTFAASAAFGQGAAPAQGAASAPDSSTSEHARKVVRMVTPVYPELARRLQMSGVVKLRATVAPNGSVKSTEVMGGHPVLIRAAQDAVTNWKFAPAPDETRELIEVDFKPR